MARRNRQSSHKALVPGHRQRNKNPKLSPYQREQKRGRLANQAPRPFVNASANASGKKKLSAATTAAQIANGTLNPALMYQKRDAPAKARGLMQYLAEKEERAAERKRKREEDAVRQADEEAEEAEMRLAARERRLNGGGSDDEDDEEWEDADGEEAEGDDEEDDNANADEEDEDEIDDEELDELDDDAEEAEEEEEDDEEMAALLADLDDATKAANAHMDAASDEEISDDEGTNTKQKISGAKMVLTHVPKDPSGKQLKAWMVKKERLDYLALKEKGDAAGCEALLKKILLREGFSFVDAEVIKAARKTKKEQIAAEIAQRREEALRKVQEKMEEKKNKKKTRVRPVFEGELTASLEDLNEELAAEMAPNGNGNNGGNSNKNTVSLSSIAVAQQNVDAHAAFAAETAQLNLKLLKKKEKKHAKKAEKRREKAFEDLNEMDQQMTEAMSKTHKKKVRKERMKEGDENYRLHQKLANMQIENLKRGTNGPKRMREEGAEGDGHDDGNVVLKFQQYENDQANKRGIKRLSTLSDADVAKAVDAEDNGGRVFERIRFGERAEAPPVFNVVPTMDAAFTKFAAKLGVNADGTPITNKQKLAAMQFNPLTARNQKVNGVSVAATRNLSAGASGGVTTNGGVRAQQKKPGKAVAMKLAMKNARGELQALLNRKAGVASSSANIVSTAARTDSNGDMSLYERKRLAKLGLMSPVTEQKVNTSRVENGGEGNHAHNSSEMEQLRQRVMQTYQNNRKAARKGPSAAAAAPVDPNYKSWMPTDRDY